MDVEKLRQLFDQRDELDDQIRAIVGGTKERKQIVCGNCQQPGHSARTCAQRKKEGGSAI